MNCDLCGWDPRGSDHIHECRPAHGPVPLGARVSSPARDGGFVTGVVLRSEKALTVGTNVLVKWDGALTGQWMPDHMLTVIVESEAAA